MGKNTNLCECFGILKNDKEWKEIKTGWKKFSKLYRN